MKAAPILLQIAEPLRRMPEEDRVVIRRFFTEHVRGADAQHHKRLLRLVADLFTARAGDGFQLYRAEARSGPFHRRHRAILTALFERQERFDNPEAMHDHLKLACWFVEWDGGVPRPKSTDYDSCSEDEIREFNDHLQELLHRPSEQEAFWPHLPPRLRQQQVDAILANPKEKPHGR